MMQVFRGANVKLRNWRQVTVLNIVCKSRKHAKTMLSVYRIRVGECTVTACRTETIVRKGGGFFYGKSSNENHFKGV